MREPVKDAPKDEAPAEERQPDAEKPARPMATGRVDRRVVKTCAAIQAAFRKLVKEQGLNKVTVSSLAREANIDRKTFYLHYESIENLVDNEVEALIDRVLCNVDETRLIDAPREQVHIVLAEVNSIISEDPELYGYIAGNLSIDFTLDRIARGVDLFQQRRAAHGPVPADSERIMYLTRFYLVGAVSVYRMWLCSDRTVPLERVSSYVEDALTSGMLEMAEGERRA